MKNTKAPNLSGVERIGEDAEVAPGVSDSLNKLIGFAMVFANIPPKIRLDVERMVTGEDTDKIDVSNLEKVVQVLGELDPELDDKFLDFFASREGGDA